MATTLYLIRHGATEGSEERRYKGSIDVPLSDEGAEEIRRSAAFLRSALNGAVLDAIYASPLSRARRSAGIIGAAFGLEPRIEQALTERHFGVWEGMTFSEIGEAYPEAFAAWARNPLEYSPVGGESTLQVRDRIIPVFERIVEDHADQHIAIVAHGGVNRVLLCHVMGLSLEHIFRIEQETAAVNIIMFYDKYPVVKLLNGGRIG